jgi:hypothetical protein
MLGNYRVVAQLLASSGTQLHRVSYYYSEHPAYPCGSVLVEALCYKPEGRVFEAPSGNLIASIIPILPAAVGSGVDSASKINEYQKHKNNISGTHSTVDTWGWEHYRHLQSVLCAGLSEVQSAISELHVGDTGRSPDKVKAIHSLISATRPVLRYQVLEKLCTVSALFCVLMPANVRYSLGQRVFNYDC